MPRYKFTIEFDGTAYAGWQRQNNAPSIQESVETAITAFCGQVCVLHGAGRTDAGVHGLAMAAHVDLEREVDSFRIQEALNYHLKPQPIAILRVELVEDEFHARFDCRARHYEYRIVNRRAPLTFERCRAWRVTAPLNEQAMHRAAQSLTGRHDFTTFRAAQCQASSPIRTLDVIDVSRYGDQVVVRCRALSFLHHQVRSMVGSLVEVGRGRWQERDVENALMAADRAACGQVAPAKGLYFVKAVYDDAM